MVAVDRGETIAEFIRRIAIILRAVGLDLDRAHQRRDAAGGLPIHVIHETEQQTRAIFGAATGVVLELEGRGGLYFDAALLQINMRALRTARHDQGLDAFGDLVRREPRALLYALRLVIVRRHPARLFDEAQQVVAVV